MRLQISKLIGFSIVLLLFLITGCNKKNRNNNIESFVMKEDTYIIQKSKDFIITGCGKNENWNRSDWLELTPNVKNRNSDFKTKAKMLYSETGIYFLFRCEDNLLTSSMDADLSDLWKEDVVEVFLWPDEKYPVYFEYEISPLNYELPILISNFEGELLRWQPFHYESNRKTDHKTFIIRNNESPNTGIDGWKAEFFIPYKLLKPLNNVPPKKGDRWRANFYRLDYDQSQRAQWVWQTINKSFHEYEKFGIIIFN